MIKKSIMIILMSNHWHRMVSSNLQGPTKQLRALFISIKLVNTESHSSPGARFETGPKVEIKKVQKDILCKLCLGNLLLDTRL